MKKILLFISFLVTFSFSAVDVSNVTLDTSAVEILAAVMLGALAIIWVARKVVSFLDGGGHAWDSQEAQDALDRYEYESSEVK